MIRIANANLWTKITVRMSRKMHQAQNDVVGYFGGYISKAQPVGMHEMRNNHSQLQHLKDKLLNRKSNPTKQMSHAIMRMFTALEATGIVKPITQEFQLAAEYHEQDYLSEFFWSMDHKDVFGGAHLSTT